MTAGLKQPSTARAFRGFGKAEHWLTQSRVSRKWQRPESRQQREARSVGFSESRDSSLIVRSRVNSIFGYKPRAVKAVVLGMAAERGLSATCPLPLGMAHAPSSYASLTPHYARVFPRGFPICSLLINFWTLRLQYVSWMQIWMA